MSYSYNSYQTSSLIGTGHRMPGIQFSCHELVRLPSRLLARDPLTVRHNSRRHQHAFLRITPFFARARDSRALPLFPYYWCGIVLVFVCVCVCARPRGPTASMVFSSRRRFWRKSSTATARSGPSTRCVRDPLAYTAYTVACGSSVNAFARVSFFGFYSTE